MKNDPFRTLSAFSIFAVPRWVAAVFLTVMTSAPGVISGAPQAIRSSQSPEAWVRAELQSGRHDDWGNYPATSVVPPDA